ncbi:metallophosphoesterase family protein [Nonomuraea typhae]|uniref:Metallophosphoesterase family protein n=1 Tax=Nonomuraea typhae TaxID=2603600 RepID=A0ABW7YU85_9ACTN
MPNRSLVAISDLHVRYQKNKEIVEALRPSSPGDWLLVAGDVAEVFDDFVWAMRLLSDRFPKVVWAPGNHELWTYPGDKATSRGVERYRLLVETCRSLGVVTPEDPYPVWDGPGGPAVVAPLFLLYDYTFRPEGTTTAEEALERAYDAGVVCTDEMFLHPDPHPTREAWCADRLKETEKRLEDRPEGLPTVLVNHYPTVREPTRVLRYPEFALWCGTEKTADWHVRFDAAAVVYGHLHIPRTTWHDGVRFDEVSLGYPREWQPRPSAPGQLRRILTGDGWPDRPPRR